MLQLWTLGGQGLLSYELTITPGVPDPRFGPGSRTISYYLADGAVVVLDLAPYIEPALVPAPVYASVFSADGTALAVQAHDGVEIWNVMSRRRGAVVPVREPTALALSADGRMLAVGTGSPATAEVWDLPGRRRIGLLPVPGAAFVGGLAFSSDGRSLAVAPRSNTWDAVRLWNLKGRPETLPHSGDEHMAFRPDGRALAVGGGENAYIDLAARPRRVSRQSFGPASTSVQSIAFSPDGTVIATGFLMTGVELRDTATRGRVGRLTASQGELDGNLALAFSPDGGVLATGNSLGMTRLWEVATCTPLGLPLAGSATGGGDPIMALAFSASGGDLYVLTSSGRLRTYPVDPDRAAAAVCARLGTAVTAAEWQRLIPEAPYRKVC